MPPRDPITPELLATHLELEGKVAEDPAWSSVLQIAADMIRELAQDKARLDWLADPKNEVGQVLLPEACIMANLDSMRHAIDDAMKLP